MPRASRAAGAAGGAVIMSAGMLGWPGEGLASHDWAPGLNGTARTEIGYGVVQAWVPASGLGPRLAVLDGRREMVGAPAAWRRRGAEFDLRVAHRAPQPMEQRFLQRPAGIRLAGILVAIRHFRDDRHGNHRGPGLPIVLAADLTGSLAPVVDAPVHRRLARRPGILPYSARSDGDRQPRPANCRGPASLHRQQPRSVGRAAQLRCHAAVV